MKRRREKIFHVCAFHIRPHKRRVYSSSIYSVVDGARYGGPPAMLLQRQRSLLARSWSIARQQEIRPLLKSQRRDTVMPFVILLLDWPYPLAAVVGKEMFWRKFHFFFTFLSKKKRASHYHPVRETVLYFEIHYFSILIGVWNRGISIRVGWAPSRSNRLPSICILIRSTVGTLYFFLTLFNVYFISLFRPADGVLAEGKCAG